MKIIVTSNCQTGGIFVSLKAFLPGAKKVEPYPMPQNEESITKLKQELKNMMYG